MSNFEVSVEKVISVTDHPNADKLDIIGIEGKAYTIISQKGNYKVGSEVVLFQPDSVLSDEFVNYFELTYLKNNRIKEAKIRGIVSQALILNLELVYNYIFDTDKIEMSSDFSFNDMYTCNLTNILGVYKYEEPEPEDNNSAGRFPKGVERYDLENAERYAQQFLKMLDEEVVITEKIEGTNWGLHLSKNNTISAMRRSSMVHEGSIYYIAAVENGYVNFIKQLGLVFPDSEITLRGELFGEKIQGNIYRTSGKHINLFDIKIDGTYLSHNVMIGLIKLYNNNTIFATLNKPISTVPIIYTGILRDFASTQEELKEKSNGRSELDPRVAREGIVIKPIAEYNDSVIGRLILKQRSPEYLSK